jgi:hypothetical protein
VPAGPAADADGSAHDRGDFPERDQVGGIAHEYPDRDRVGFQNSATGPGLGFYAARSYSLMRPPRTGRRWMHFRDRFATG